MGKVNRGETNCEILLYLANSGNATTASIRECIKTNLAIESKRVTYAHLDELKAKKQVGKVSTGRGKTDYYFLLENFVVIQQIYNYLKYYNRENEFIKTKYFKSYVSSDDFRARTFVYFFKEIFLALIEYAQSDKAYDALIKKTKGNETAKEILDIIRSADKYNAKYTKSTDFNKVMTLCKAKKLDKVQILSSILVIIKNTDSDTIFSYLRSLNKNVVSIINKEFLTIIIPEKEIPEISAMMRSSPTAADYILNFKFDSIVEQLDVMTLIEILLKPQIVRVLEDPAKAVVVSQDKNSLQKILESLKDFSNVGNKSSVYTLMSSALIYDFLHKNLDVQEKDKDVINSILTGIFLPKIKA